jgi:hypothetical protein
VATHLRTELALKALDMALGQHRFAAIDRFSRGFVRQRHVRERFATLERELLDRHHFNPDRSASGGIQKFIEGLLRYRV